MHPAKPRIGEPTIVERREIGVASGWPLLPDERRPRRDLANWALRHRLRYKPSARCEHWLRDGTRCAMASRETGGWRDHVSAWTRDGAPAVVVAYPYNLYRRDFAELDELRGQGFDVRVDATGGWYGNSTAMIEIWDVEPDYEHDVEREVKR